MRSRYPRALFVCLALFFAATYMVSAATSLSTISPSSQNFDGIGATATAVLPTDFRVDKLSTSASQIRTVGTFSGATSATQFAGGASLSSSASNGIYNFGAGTPITGSDRAVGFLSSSGGTFSGNLYAQFANATSSNLSGLQIAYGVEKYRGGSNAAGLSLSGILCVGHNMRSVHAPETEIVHV
jgi:hypothetical protein